MENKDILPDELKKADDKPPEKPKTPSETGTSPKKMLAYKLVLYILSAISSAYVFAFLIGFFGFDGPIKALTEPGLREYVWILAVIISVIVGISLILTKDNLPAIKKLMVGEAIFVAIVIIVMSIFPGLAIRNWPIIQAKNAQLLNHAANSGTYFLATFDKAPLYIFDENGKLNYKMPEPEPKTPNPFFLNKGEKYLVADRRTIKEVGPLKLIKVWFLVDENKIPTDDDVYWVRLDHGEFFSPAQPKKEKETPPPPDYIIYHPGQIKVFELKAGEESDHFVRINDGVKIKFQIKHGDFNVVTRSGKVYEIKSIPPYMPEDFKIRAPTDTDMRLIFS